MCTSAPRAPHSAHKEVEPLEVLQKVPTQRVGILRPQLVVLFNTFVLFNNAQRAHARMTCAVVRTPQALEGRISLLVWMDFCCSTEHRIGLLDTDPLSERPLSHEGIHLYLTEFLAGKKP